MRVYATELICCTGVLGFQTFNSRFVCVIAWSPGQLRIKFTRIFKVFTKSPETGSEEGNLENFENTSEMNPYLHEGTSRLHVYHMKGKF